MGRTRGRQQGRRQQGGGRRFGGGVRERLQRVRDINRTQLGIALAALVLAITIFFPRFYPAAKRGPTCSNLAQPLGGNNRSVLAYNSDQSANLELDIELDGDSFRLNQSLTVRVNFRNNDQGAMILYLPKPSPVPINRVSEGIYFEIAPVNAAFPVTPQGTIAASPTAFIGSDLFDLHLLGSHARCHEDFTLSANTLNALGLVAGQDYRIRAFYRSSSDGDLLTYNNDLIQNQGVTPTATAFQEYLDSQGVWTGEVSSDEKRFSIQREPTPAPAAPPPAG